MRCLYASNCNFSLLERPLKERTGAYNPSQRPPSIFNDQDKLIMGISVLVKKTERAKLASKRPGPAVLALVPENREAMSDTRREAALRCNVRRTNIERSYKDKFDEGEPVNRFPFRNIPLMAADKGLYD